VQAALEIRNLDLELRKALGPAVEDPRAAARAVGQQQASWLYEPQRRNWTVWFPRARHSRRPPVSTGRASTPAAASTLAAIAAREPVSQIVTTGRPFARSSP